MSIINHVFFSGTADFDKDSSVFQGSKNSGAQWLFNGHVYCAYNDGTGVGWKWLCAVDKREENHRNFWGVMKLLFKLLWFTMVHNELLFRGPWGETTVHVLSVQVPIVQVGWQRQVCMKDSNICNSSSSSPCCCCSEARFVGTRKGFFFLIVFQWRYSLLIGMIPRRVASLILGEILKQSDYRPFCGGQWMYFCNIQTHEQTCEKRQGTYTHFHR